MFLSSLFKKAGQIVLPKNVPGFIILGAQKSGTTSLHYYLAQHPNLRGSTPKEVHFFDRDIHFGKTFEQYKSHFRGGRKNLYFESSPSYLYVPETAERIYREFPKNKFVIVLRDPIKRAYSAWNHYRQIFESERLSIAFEQKPRREGSKLYEAFFHGRKSFPTFRECIEIEQLLIEQQDGYEPALLRRGLYLEQLERYWEFFEPEQLLILGFKDLVVDTDKTLNRVCDFLAVDSIDWSTIDREPRNVREYSEPMSEADKKYLQTFFAKPNQELFERTGSINW